MDIRNKKIAIKESIPRGDSQKGLKGFVEIYKKSSPDEKYLLHAKSNLIVFSGREWVLQKLFDIQNNDASTSTPPTYGIKWISFGDGGAPTTDPLNPTPPLNTDVALCNEIIIANDDTQYADGGKKKKLTQKQFIQDNANDNRYLIMQLNSTLSEIEANNSSINEAGLWISNSGNAAADPDPATEFYLFAHVTFPSIVKDPSLTLQILWYIYS
jgi:hypothetical protein